MEINSNDWERIRQKNDWQMHSLIYPHGLLELNTTEALREDILPVPGTSESGRFRLLTKGDDYNLNEYTGFLTFNTQINNDDIIAVAYRVENRQGAQDDGFYGEFITTAATDSQRLILKLIKPANLQPGGNFTQAWKLAAKKYLSCWRKKY